jgi:hypothetical protein
MNLQGIVGALKAEPISFVKSPPALYHDGLGFPLFCQKGEIPLYGEEPAA